METVGTVAAIAAVMAFGCGACLVPAAIGRARWMRATARMQDAALAGGSRIERLLRNGIPPATAVASRLVRIGSVRGYFDEMSRFARARGCDTTAEKTGGVMLVAIVLLFGGAMLLSLSLAFSVMLVICLVIGLGMVARHARERQREALREEVPDMLHAMSACFHAGYTIVQTFHQLSCDAGAQLRALFRRAESDLRTGRSTAEALQRLREGAELPELAFVAAALEIQHQTGGSLQKIIDSACDSIEGELALRRSLRVQTAQARLSMRVVTVMPFALIAIFSLVSPGFLAPFFATPVGVAVFGLAMLMQVAGIVSVRRMLDVKEG